MLQLDLKTFFKNPFRDGLFFLPTFFLSFHAPSEFMSLFFTAHYKKEGGIEKSFGRQKMLETAKPSGVIFFRTKGEDRNSFISIHRHKFAVQKQRVSDGAMKKHTRGGRKQGKGKNGNKKRVKSNLIYTDI